MIKLKHISFITAAVCFDQRSDILGSKFVLITSFDKLIYKIFTIVVKENVPYGFCHASEVAFDNVMVIRLYQTEVGRNIKTAALCLAVKNGFARSDSDGWVSCTYIFDHFIAFHTIKGQTPGLVTNC